MTGLIAVALVCGAGFAGGDGMVEPAAAGVVSSGRTAAGEHAVIYVARSGERNDVHVRRVVDNQDDRYPQYAYVTDTAGVEAGAGCAPVEAEPVETVACDVTHTSVLWAFVARLGDRDDHVTADDVGVHGTRLYGGPGDDTMVGAPHWTNVLNGGRGDDRMLAADSATTIFDEGARSNGADVMVGLTADKPLELSTWVDYSARTAPVRADLAGRRNDGARGEHDTIQTVDAIIGGRGSDVLRGGPGSQALIGGPATDVLTGGPGDDFLDAGWPGRAMPGSARADHDRLRGGAGVDTLVAGPGGNRLVGGAGPDFLIGWRGDDRIFSRDGVPDNVRCGRGRDRLRHDALDFYRGCGRRARRPAAPVLVAASAWARKFGDRYLDVDAGCSGRVAVPCSGAVSLLVDDAMVASGRFTGGGVSRVRFTPDSAGFARVPFDDVWELVRDRSPRVSVTVRRRVSPAAALPLSELHVRRSPLPVYLPEQVVDHVPSRRARALH